MMMSTQTTAASTRKSSQQRARRTAGFCTNEAVVTLCLIAAGVLAIDMMAGTAEGFSAYQYQRSQAIAIAEGQLHIVRGLAFEELVESEAFAAPSWIARPGHAAGEIAVEIRNSQDGSVQLDDVYRVAWKVTTRAGAKDIKDIAMRVSWDTLDGSNRDVELEAWRVR